VALVARICNGEDTEDHALLRQAQDATPNGEISDLIYWSKRPMTPEEIVDEALKRGEEWRRIQL